MMAARVPRLRSFVWYGTVTRSSGLSGCLKWRWHDYLHLFCDRLGRAVGRNRFAVLDEAFEVTADGVGRHGACLLQ